MLYSRPLEGVRQNGLFPKRSPQQWEELSFDRRFGCKIHDGFMNELHGDCVSDCALV
jgi:hypothetical protein